MDVHNTETRKYNMSQIKGKDTKPEMIVRKFLHSEGFRYRLHSKKLPGQPDIVLKRYNTIVQIHGCFWHKHAGCKYATIPKTRTDWWQKKINDTVERDQENCRKLTEMGWKICIVWECELKKEKRDDTLVQLKKKIQENLNGK